MINQEIVYSNYQTYQEYIKEHPIQQELLHRCSVQLCYLKRIYQEKLISELERNAIENEIRKDYHKALIHSR